MTSRIEYGVQRIAEDGQPYWAVHVTGSAESAWALANDAYAPGAVRVVKREVTEWEDAK